MRYAWLCGVFLCAAGCFGSSDDDDHDDGDGTASGGTSSSGGGIPLQNLGLELGQASCGKVFECCSAEEIMANPLLGMDEAACALTIAAFSSLLVGPIQTSVTAGRVQFDGVAFEGCIAAMESLSCADARNGTADPIAAQNCGQFLIPLVELGGECVESFDCINGWCDDTAGSLCSPLEEDGSECSSDDECQSDYCDLVEGCAGEPASTGDNLCGSTM